MQKNFLGKKLQATKKWPTHPHYPFQQSFSWPPDVYVKNAYFQNWSNEQWNATNRKITLNWPKKAWFTMFTSLVREILRFENQQKCLVCTFFLIFKPQYLMNHICKHSKPYHFYLLNVPFLLIAFNCSFNQFWK